MPIVHLLRNAAFDPETTSLLVTAFNEAWESVQRSGSELALDGHAEETRTVLAKRIIEMGARGNRNQRDLVADALAYLVDAQAAKTLMAS